MTTSVVPSPLASSVTRQRPQSASRVRPLATTSLVQQKLHGALHSAEHTAAALIKSQHASFKARGVANAEAIEKEQGDRSISRYRNDAAIVSFIDCPATLTPPFFYANNFMPGVHFYTFLAAKVDTIHHHQQPPEDGAPRSTRKPSTAGALRMWIPDTIVYGETGRAVWLYSDEDGFVQRSTDFQEKTVVEKLTPAVGGDPEQHVVVCKEPITKLSTVKKSASVSVSAAADAHVYEGNLLRLLSPGELKTVLSNVSSTQSGKSFALQRFVRCNGAKAFLVRAVYEYNKPAYAWMINNTVPMQTPAPTVSQVLQSLGQDALAPPTAGGSRQSIVAQPETAQAATTQDSSPSDVATPAVPLVNRLCTSIQVDKSCTFIKLSERGCSTVAELNARIVKFLEHRLHLQLQSLVADFVKDADGKWWLLQVKHFRVRPVNPSSGKPFFSLPRRLRVLYLGYRDSSLVEDATDSDEDAEQERRYAHIAAQLAQRQVRKLQQCKCCLAAYPKDELAFKMTLKMINEMLLRVRARLAPEKSYSFLTAALARESSPDPSLAYESWSVCSYCYAIYERDQQLQRVEAKFAEMLGTPDLRVVASGLGRLAENAYVIDPTASTTVLPAQLTLCRLMLVINGIYDIPPELYDAEKDHPLDAGLSTGYALGASRLYLRIAALGYTECIPIDASDIIITQEQAPRGMRQRKASDLSSMGDEDEGDDGDAGRRKRNYWLPLNVIRSVHFFAPRTPLHAKLKETSGLVPFLNEDNSISIQFIRATEPPLQELANPVASASGVERQQVRRAALKPLRKSTVKASRPAADSPSRRVGGTANHSVLLGATKLRMAQFRSAYVTKLDFYACMALRGEMFNIKGNIGFERVRYVDTKLLTSQHRLRAYNGVFIPDATYMPSDPLTSEWMDCLRSAVNPLVGRHAGGSDSDDDDDVRRAGPRTNTRVIRSSASTTSLSAGNEEMDEELEQMIDRREGRPKQTATRPQATEAPPLPTTEVTPSKPVIAPSNRSPTRTDLQMATLMQKTLRSPRQQPLSPPLTGHLQAEANSTRSLWSFVVQLSQIHHLYTRERMYCRWECYYELFGQRRSAVERPVQSCPTSPQQSPSGGGTIPEITFNCTHRFFLDATASMLQSHFASNRSVVLNFRNDVYASTRSVSPGEFYCAMDVSRLLESRSFDATLDILPSPTTTALTPREAAAVSKSPPYLAVSVELSRLALDPDGAVSSGDYVRVGSTSEGIHVLKKIT